MTEARWREVCEVFDAALPLGERGRRELLARVAGRDSALRDEVASLLGWSARAEGFLDPRSGRPVLELDPRVGLTEPLPRVLGRYRLLEVLGHGGMSVVYLGERIDGEYEQRVAVKLLPRGLDSLERVQRFRAERQILAGLDHPGIAKLLDGGTSEEGLPYLVMEYVDGEPIDLYVRQKGLGIEERLRLFLRVCDAVQYAHQRLVVHRDIKPSNLLVSATGEPKLVDFGIAKLLGLAEREGLTGSVLEGVRPMTPEYASPEQVRGETITTASDVYSLGALLYELLCGQRAHRLANRTPQEILRAVCDEQPEAPSLAAGRPARAWGRPWGRRLAGDLDNIVLMALRKEPRRRYPSVAELAGDIERFLAGLPVRAHGDGLRYRLGKFVRRHRGRLVVAAGVAGVLATLGWSAWRQSQEALLQRNSARALSTFLEEVFTAPDPRSARGEPLTAKEVLERGVRQIHGRRDLDPLVAANLLSTVGNVLTAMGNYPEAEAAHQRALTRRRARGGPPSELARGLRDLGESIRLQGDSARAEVYLAEAVSLARATLPAEHPERALSEAALAVSLHRQGRLDEASALFDSALGVARPRLAERDPKASADDLAALAAIVMRSASLRGEQGRLDEAEALSLESLRAFEAIRPPPHPDLAFALNNVGLHYLLRGRYLEARGYLVRAAAMRRVLLGDAHPSLAASLDLLAHCHEARWELDAAAVVRQEAARVFTAAHGPHHAAVLRQAVLLAAGRAQRLPRAVAEADLRAAWQHMRETLGADHPYALLASARVTEVLLLWDEVEEVERLLEEIERHHDALIGQSNLDESALLTLRAELLASKGDLVGARALAEQALALVRGTLGVRHDRAGRLSYLLAELELRAGEVGRAEAGAREAESILDERLGPSHPRTIRARRLLAELEGRRR